jgi:hypothetical protein
MNPGLPGTGIGGLFYILTALWMPVCEIWRRLRGDASGRWSVVAMQFAIAAGVVAAIVGVFWALDSAVLLHDASKHVAGKVEMFVVGKVEVMRSMRVSALEITAGVLAALLSSVHLARFFFWLRDVRPAGR